MSLTSNFVFISHTLVDSHDYNHTLVDDYNYTIVVWNLAEPRPQGRLRDFKFLAWGMNLAPIFFITPSTCTFYEMITKIGIGGIEPEILRVAHSKVSNQHYLTISSGL